MTNTSQGPTTWQIDLAWIGLLLLTGLMGYAADLESSSQVLMAISAAKAVLISAIFMGLWRASRRIWAGLVLFFFLMAASLSFLLP